MYLLHTVWAFTRRHLNALIIPSAISLAIVSALAFSVPIHRRISTLALETITAEVAGKPKKFSERALEEVADANEDVDDFFSLALFHPERHFTNERFADSSARIRELRTQIKTNLTANPPNGDEARKLVGQALHTIQDFYAHSNWVELGRRGINMELGRSVLTDPATTLQACPTNSGTLGPNGGGGLTSAYYLGAAGCGPLPYPGKCHHGVAFNCAGINKDTPGQGAPGDHAIARTIAEAASKDYVEQVLSDIAGNDKAIRALLDLNGTLGFVIDDTGSMGEEINGVKSTVTRIVNEVRDNPDRQPDNYLLVRFGDPDVGSAFVTDSADALLSAVSALSAKGGDDCPELSQAGLLRTFDKISLNSRLYLFTDAGAKDSSLRNEVISRAQEKSARLSYVLTGTCSPVDEAYIRGAAETGGQLFLLNQFEIPKLFDLIKPQLSGDLGTILSTKGVLTTSAPRVFDVPVDSTVQRLVVSVSIDTRTAITLRRPSGVLVSPSDPDAQITDITSGRILTIEAPAPGTWQVEISGGGNFSVVAAGNSPIDFYRFDFVKPSGDIHGGFSPIPGQPLAGAEGTGEAAILGSFTTAAFKLVSEEGETIKDINLVQNFPDAAPEHFFGMFVLPDVPFRVVATGNDIAGFPYQRTFPTVYRAQVVGVTVNAGASDVVRVGTTTTFNFTVKNLGGPATFRINVVSSLGSISGVSPTVLNLATNASGTVQFAVTVPSGTPSGTNLAVTLTATKTDDSTIFNSAILNLVVTDVLPLVAQFSGDSFTVSEGAGHLNATVTLSVPAPAPITIDYATSPDTTENSCAVVNNVASERCDFTTTLGTLRFAAGEQTKSFNIFIDDDAYMEGVETFTVSLSNPTGGLALGAPAMIVVSISDNDGTSNAANPIDTPPFFVGMHYVDFLNRQGEAAGVSAWVDALNNCPADTFSCARVGVSSAFFRAEEFMLKGNFVIRFYKASLGVNPNYRDFTRDSQRVTGATAAEVFAARDAFTDEWVQRADFRAIYDGLSNQGYVDKLEQTAGIMLANKSQLVSDLDTMAKTRAQVLRDVVDSQEVKARMYNDAFVLMEYFGYLRRDPETAGYQAWLAYLNAHPKDFRTMVHGFVNSLEYRLRFGQP